MTSVLRGAACSKNLHRPHFFSKYLIAGWLCILVVYAVSDNTAPPGFMQGHLRIVSGRPVELADGNASTVTAETYAEYPLIILSQKGKKEIVRLSADGNGNYRVSLPPGAYILDVQDRTRKHVRANPQLFTVVSNQTVRVDMDMDTGIR
jgi:hypothetical protein